LAAVNVIFESIDVRAKTEVPGRLLPAWPDWASGMTFAAIDEGRRGLPYLDGRLTRKLERWRFWPGNPDPGRGHPASEIPAVLEIADATTARAGWKDVNEFLHRILQIAGKCRALARSRERNRAPGNHPAQGDGRHALLNLAPRLKETRSPGKDRR